MAYECEYCDHCGSKEQIDGIYPISELKQDIASANKGESAVLCSSCHKEYTNDKLILED